MSSLHNAQIRSTLISERIRQRTDQSLRNLIDDFGTELDFRPLDGLMISEQAWEHVTSFGIDPKLVFAHPALLRAHPSTSQVTTQTS